MSSLVPIALQNFQTSTTSYTTDTATQLTLPSDAIATLTANLTVSGQFIAVTVFDGINQEFMFITGVSFGAANVTRGVEGTTAVPLAQGATVAFVWTETALNAIFPGGSVTCTGSGATSVTGGPNYTIFSPGYSFLAGPGISVSGGPTYTISNTAPAGATGPAGPPGPSTLVTGTGVATATTISGGYNVNVDPVAFTGGTGISITGTYPNFTITNTQTPGGTGTVTNLVAGTGITISGSTPTINPTVSLTPTGITAGTYGGITVNASGQISAIASGFVTSISTSTTGLTIATPTVGSYTVNANSATTSGQGLVALAPATSSGSNDPSNTTQAVTPAGVNAVITALPTVSTTLLGSGNQIALSAATYTTPVSGLSLTVNVAAGKSAIVDIYVEVFDPSNPTVVQNFAIGLFNGATLLAGNSNVLGCIRHLRYLITGALATVLTVNTTALTGTQAVQSRYMYLVGN